MPSRAVFCAFFLFLAGRGEGWPVDLHSTSLNLPIEETEHLAEMIDVFVADTPRDHAMVENTFREPTIYNFIQNSLGNIVQPTPLVDNLKEEDKYGNDGDKFLPFGNFVVKGTEGATQLASAVVGVPGRLFKTASTKTTEVLNRLGGRLIGI